MPEVSVEYEFIIEKLQKTILDKTEEINRLQYECDAIKFHNKQLCKRVELLQKDSFKKPHEASIINNDQQNDNVIDILNLELQEKISLNQKLNDDMLNIERIYSQKILELEKNRNSTNEYSFSPLIISDIVLLMIVFSETQLHKYHLSQIFLSIDRRLLKLKDDQGHKSMVHMIKDNEIFSKTFFITTKMDSHNINEITDSVARSIFTFLPDTKSLIQDLDFKNLTNKSEITNLTDILFDNWKLECLTRKIKDINFESVKPVFRYIIQYLILHHKLKTVSADVILPREFIKDVLESYHDIKIKWINFLQKQANYSVREIEQKSLEVAKKMHFDVETEFLREKQGILKELAYFKSKSDVLDEKLNLLESHSQDENGVDRLQLNIFEKHNAALKDELLTVKANYEDQITTLSDHICVLNEKLQSFI